MKRLGVTTTRVLTRSSTKAREKQIGDKRKKIKINFAIF
jgi:hypothetical protein